MKINRFLNFLFKMDRKRKRQALMVIIFLLLFNTFLVFITGGIPSAFAHTMYLPVLIAAIYFGAIKAMIVGVIGGLLVGPLMLLPFLSVTSEPFWNSFYRLIYFVVIGGIVGNLLTYLQKQLEKVHMLHTHEVDSGIPNVNYYLETIPSEEATLDKVSMTMQINNHESLILLLGNYKYHLLLFDLYQAIKQHLLDDCIMVYVDERRFWIELSKTSFDTIQSTFVEKIESITLLSDGIPLYFDFSIGVNAFNEPKNYKTRFRESDIASMYAKNRTLKYVVYQESFEQEQQMFLRLGELPKAIQDNELFLVYQPIVDLKTGACIGLEALIRWNHEGRVLYPGDFIPLAEKTRVINPITEWVTSQALRDFETLQKIGLPMHLSINISSRNLYEPELIQSIIQKIDAASIPNHALEIEITESTLMLNRDAAHSFLTRLKQKGVNIVLDDFGKEYSSLAYLRDLPVEKVKIDREFTMNITTNPHIYNMVKVMIDLIHRMNLKVVAEGIENQEILDILLKMGCDSGQGYLYAKPMPLKNIIDWINMKGKTNEN